MKSKLTPWFPMSVNPVRVGVYKMETGSYYPRYSKWDGTQWMFSCDSIQDASIMCSRSEDCYDGYITGWRGLTRG